MQSEPRRHGPHNQFQGLHVRHILPKPNEIVHISQQQIKHIYPFPLLAAAPSATLKQTVPSVKYQNKNGIRAKFVPSKKSITEHFKTSGIVYGKFSDGVGPKATAMNIFSADKLKSLRQNDFILPKVEQFPFEAKDAKVKFDSCFESGNLSLVSIVDDLHCLLLHNDVNTTGYTNWFYFSVQSKQTTKLRMAIMNYGKAGWPMNNYPGVCVWSEKEPKWTRQHCNLSCQSNKKLYESHPAYDKFNTLYLEYQLPANTKTYFAYNVPYTYTDLLKILDEYSAMKHPHFHRKLAGTTLIGNRLEMLTIANFQKMRKKQKDQQVIVILARTHPGETVSSWIVHHLIRFLLSEEAEACALRSAFVFKIFPMVNPDGVIHGNYRCSLIGRDLNRRWKAPSKDLYPEVYFIKNQIMDTHEQKQIKMILDLHGHTQKRRAFFYGCTDKSAPHKTRLFPYLMTKLSAFFDYGSCNFAMQKCKESTARITLFNTIRVPQIFTLETSQFGMLDKFLSSEVYEQIAVTLCRAIVKMYRITQKNNAFGKGEKQIDEVEEQLMGNANLLKIGCLPSDGSDSEPSVCNLNFDKINKLALHNNPRPATQNSLKRRVIICPQSRPQSSLKARTHRQTGLSMGCSREMSQKMSESGFILPNKALSPLKLGSSVSHRRPNSKLTKRMDHSLQKLKYLNSERKPVRMINFELLINESAGFVSALHENLDKDIKLNHTNYQMIQRRWPGGSRAGQSSKTYA